MATDMLKTIKNLAMERHLSMKALAEECGYTPANLYQILSGDNPQLRTVEKLATALGSSVEYLLRIWKKNSDD